MVVLPRVELLVLWGWLIHISLGYSYELKAHVTFTSDTADYGQPLVGSFATYGEASTDRRRGKLVLPSETYGCSESNATLPRISSGVSFIVVLPLSECNDYFQARRAYRDNAAGVVFYYTSDSSRDSTTSGNGIVLAIPVAVVKVDNDLLDYITGQKSPQYTDVAIEGVNYTVFQQSRTFYFIVTAFCILILLSCLWFFTSYFRRCRHSVRNRRRQARAQNSARKAISKLKVRYYKVPKGSQDRENCAVCLELYSVNDVIRVLPCKHEFHRNCVDPWLKLKQTCPLCKVNITEKSATEQTRHHLHTNPHRMLSLSDSISSTSDSSSIADGSTRPQQQERRLLDSAEVAINVDAEEETIAPDTPIV